jgi:predicted HTH domain antitoxin
LFAILYIANMPTTTIAARVGTEEAALIETLAEMEGCDRSTLIKSIVRRGIKALRLDRAVAAFRAEEITLSRAAELAGLSTWDFLALMPKEQLDLHYDIAEFEDDLQRLDQHVLSK